MSKLPFVLALLLGSCGCAYRTRPASPTTRRLDLTWRTLVEPSDSGAIPIARFATGFPEPILTWFLPFGYRWTIHVARFDSSSARLAEPKKLHFVALVSHESDPCVGASHAMQLARARNRMLLIGAREPIAGRGGLLSAHVVPRTSWAPGEKESPDRADYEFEPRGRGRNSIHDLFGPPNMDDAARMPPFVQGVFDVQALSTSREFSVFGSTWDARIWGSSSPDGGGSWHKPVIIAEHGIHPAAVEVGAGHLFVFYVKTDGQVNIGTEGGRIIVTPLTGSLWLAERSTTGLWTRPKMLVDRTDISHVSASSDAAGNVYVLVDAYPEGPARLRTSCDGIDYLPSSHPYWSGWGGKTPPKSVLPSSQTLLMGSWDGGRSWTTPVVLQTDQDAYYSDSEVKAHEGRLLLTSTRRKGTAASLVGAVLSSDMDLLGP